MKTLIFCRTSALTSNAGGPSGYLFHLHDGLHATAKEGPSPAFIEAVDNTASARQFARPLRNDWRARLSRLFRRAQSHLYLATGFPPTLNPLHYRRKPVPTACLAALSRCDLVHVHNTQDADRLHLLRKAGLWQGRIVLSSHSPEAPALEIVYRRRPKGYAACYFSRMQADLLRRDLEAFRNADAWIFPSAHALEPYLETLPGFAELLREKLVRFVPTGIRRPGVPAPEAIARRRLAGGAELQVCYVGRHNSVKGYDLFRDAGLHLLAARPDVRIVCAGAGQIPPPEHPRWHELGYIRDVPALLHASDFFILPNRRTYYDLVLLEALAAGVPALATDTGGNRDVAAETDAVRLCAPRVDALRVALLELCALPREARLAACAAARRGYEAHHTSETFARAYRAAIADLTLQFARTP